MPDAITSPPGEEVTSPPDNENQPPTEIITSPPGNAVTSPPADKNDTPEAENPAPNPPQKTDPEVEDTPVIADKTNFKTNDLSAIQKAGLKLAAGVGSVITLVIIITLFQSVYIMFHPKTDSVLSSQSKFEEILTKNAAALNSSNPEEKRQAEDLIKPFRENVSEAIQNDSTWNRITSLFDLVVVKALLPIFTTILGYIFGSRAAAGSDS